MNWNNALRHLRRVRFGRLFTPVIQVSPALGPGQRFSEAEDGGQVENMATAVASAMPSAAPLLWELTNEAAELQEDPKASANTCRAGRPAVTPADTSGSCTDAAVFPAASGTVTANT